MQTQFVPPDELLVQRSRAVRARRGQLDLERAALIARGAVLRLRADQALLHAHLVRSAAVHTLLQSAETVPPRRPLAPDERSVFLPVAAFAALVAEFLQEMAASPRGEAAADHHAASHTSPRHDRMLSLIARGRELQRHPAHLALLPPAPAHERQA